jgi:hypothetical protein
MVLVVESWHALKSHIEAFPVAPILYKIDYYGEKEVLVRIQVGRVGFKKRFKRNDPELEAILSFIEERGAIRLVEAKPDDQFFM